MKLRVGYELLYEFPQPTPVIMMLNIHFTRVSDLAAPDHIVVSPSVPIHGYRDGFGNWCSRMLAPAGRMRVSTDAVVTDSGLPDPVVANASQCPVAELPRKPLYFCSPAASVTAIGFWTWLGLCSERLSPAGRASRRSAISCIGASRSATSTRG